jgi:hypothetical protein
MGFNQKNFTRYFFAYWVNGEFHNTIREAPSPMSPNDFRNVEQEIQMQDDYNERPVIINYRRLTE